MIIFFAADEIVGEKHIRPPHSQIDNNMCLAEQPVSLIKVDVGAAPAACLLFWGAFPISSTSHCGVLFFFSAFRTFAAVL